MPDQEIHTKRGSWLSKGPSTPQAGFLDGQQPLYAALRNQDEERVYCGTPPFLHVAEYDSAKSLDDLSWTQAEIGVFASKEPRQYRILIHRANCLINNVISENALLSIKELRPNTLQVNPDSDALVPVYAFNSQCPALWFVTKGQTKFSFKSLRGLHGPLAPPINEQLMLTSGLEDLLEFQKSFMGEPLSHYAHIESIALCDGDRTKVGPLSDATVQIWGIDSTQPMPPPSPSQPTGLQNVRSAQFTQTARILIFTSDTIYLILSITPTPS